jgi:phage major head subunit gpT-like protein
MILNSQNLRTLNVAFNAAFNGGFAGFQSQVDQVATRVPSTTGEEEYGWLGQIPGMREWIGDRQIRNLSTSNYSIKNKPFELTVGVPRPKVEDDQYGVYTPMFTELGRSASAHPDTLGFALLKNGFSTNCYDGQYFFDTDHPVEQPDGTFASVANTDGGSGDPWFILDTTRALKPLILQVRKPAQFVALANPDDPNVFFQDQFVYGVDGRWNVGFGFWQMAWGSKQTLDDTHLTAGLAALGSLKKPSGEPLGIAPNLLVVGPSNEFAARKLVAAATAANGATNVLNGRLQLLVVPWLA